MTEPEPRPRRRRAAAEPEKLAPGLYAIGRFGDRHDLTERHDLWVSDMGTADLYATEGYLRHALALVELERTARQMDQHRQLSRALDLRDAEPAILHSATPRRRPFTDTSGVPTEVLERVRDGLAENLAADPEVKAVMDASVAELNAVRDEYRSAEMRPKTVEEMADSFGPGYSDELPPEVAAKVDEALADPSTFVKRNRPRKRDAETTAAAIGGVVVTGGLEEKLLTSANQNEAGGRPAQPWDSDRDDPWEGIGGSGA